MAAFTGQGGRTADNIAELDIVTCDGVRLRVGKTSDEDLTRIITEGGRRGQIYGDLKALRDRYAKKIREKAEFLSHYYRGRLRPRSAYAMGSSSVGRNWRPPRRAWRTSSRTPPGSPRLSGCWAGLRAPAEFRALRRGRFTSPSPGGNTPKGPGSEAA